MDQTFEKRKKIIYEFICDDMYVPMKLKELAILLQVPKEQRSELKAVMDALEAEGKVHVSQKGKYLKGAGRTLRGVYQAHPRGFGFVTIEGETDDIFIPEKETNGALHGDTVEILLTASPEGKRKEGKIVKIAERGTAKIVGLYQVAKGKHYGFVIPDNQRFLQDIFVPEERAKGAVDGHKVVVELTSYGSDNAKPEGKIVEILGHVNDPGVDIMSIVKSYDLPVEFPEKVMNQAERVPEEVSDADMAGRKDLREWVMVTIDGEDAKDLDDAVSLTRTEDGKNWILGVHIADVANYVQERSALDREALHRGTSVYLADRVIPMLPHRLSNGICSLNAGVDRLAMSCIMTVDAKGDVIDHEICESVIRVNERMSYTSVKKILEDHDEEETTRYIDLVPMFEEMEQLAGILRNRRHQRGSIDFDFPESKIILDAQGKPLEIKPYERNAATKIIEDFMLAANETVAEDYFWQSLPFLYRTHDNPDPEKMKQLGTFIHNFGYFIRLQQGEIHPKELQKLLDKIEGTPEEVLLSRLTLRSMKQAKYTTLCSGHFGLAARYYTHFTSPIRRYPDLQIHRIIKEILKGGLGNKRVSHYEAILPGVAMQTSALERRAEEAERETDKLKKCEYMSRFIGQEFDGVVSGVTNWGLYVELPNTVEGLVRISELRDDYYIFDEQHYELVGEMTKKTFKLGQTIRVQVVSTDRLLRTVDFILPRDWDRSAGKEASVQGCKSHMQS